MRWTFLLLILAGAIGCHRSSGNGNNGTGGAGAGAGGGGGGGAGGGGIPANGPFVAAVYTADNKLDGVRQLFAINTAGGVLDLSHSLGDAVHVDEFALSPDQRQVAYGAEGVADPGLFISPVNDDTPVPIGPRNVVVEELAWRPNGSVIAYRASASPAQLFLIAPDGTGLLDVTGGVAEVFTRIAWSPDGQWLAFRWDRDTAGQHDLWVVRADGSGLRRIAGMTATTGVRFVAYAWSPVANCIAFGADLETEGVRDLYVVDIDGGGAEARVSIEAGTTGSVGAFDFDWSPDGSALAYRRKDAATDDHALFQVSKVGGDARRISGSAGSVRLFQWSHDSSRVAFKDAAAIYTTDGDAPPIEHGRHTFIGSFDWAPSDRSLAYVADSALAPNLYQIDFAAGTTTQVAEDVDGFAFEAASQLAGLTEAEVLLVTFFGSVEFGLAVLESLEKEGSKTRQVLPRGVGRCTYYRDPEGKIHCFAERDVGQGNFLASIPTVSNPASEAILGANVVPAFANKLVDGTFPVAGFGQAFDTVFERPGGSQSLQWFVLVNGQRLTIEIFEFNPLFGAQILPNRYLGTFQDRFFELATPSPPLLLDEVGFPTTITLQLEPFILPGEPFSVLWNLSGTLDPNDGLPSFAVLASPNPVIACLNSGAPTILHSLPEGGIELLIVDTDKIVVLGIHTNRGRFKVVYYTAEGDPVFGWVDFDDVELDASVPLPVVAE